MAESYVRTALELRDLGELAFFGRFNGETARVCSGFPALKSDDVARNVFDLHQRHGQAIWDVLNAAVANHSAELIERSLPASSVLMVTVMPGAKPVLSTGSKRADPLEPLIRDEPEYGTDENGETRREKGVSTEHRAAPRQSRGKSKPGFERARGVIRELYPSGVPAQVTEPNTHLCRRVGESLKQAGLPGVSDDTILRAAGRRK
jgi:hypothetical protein